MCTHVHTHYTHACRIVCLLPLTHNAEHSTSMQHSGNTTRPIEAKWLLHCSLDLKYRRMYVWWIYVHLHTYLLLHISPLSCWMPSSEQASTECSNSHFWLLLQQLHVHIHVHEHAPIMLSSGYFCSLKDLPEDCVLRGVRSTYAWCRWSWWCASGIQWLSTLRWPHNVRYAG